MRLREVILYWAITLVLLYIVWHSLASHLFWFTQFCVLSSLSMIAWTVAHKIYEYWHPERIQDAHNKVVLVTGCDSGFGHQLVQRLDSFGFYVFAGVLFPDGDGASDLKTKCSKRLRILPMDVSKQDEVENVVEEIRKSRKPLWAIVNNAGIAIGCPFDWGNDIDAYRKTYEVNVFGLVRVTKCCIPLLRKFRGRVINIASVAGRLTVPMMSHYCMAKHSVRVFSDVLRRELYREGVQVVTIEPTFYRTSIIDFEQINKTRDKIFAQTPEDIRSAYSSQHVESLKDLEKLVNVVSRNDITEVVDTMENAVTLANPKSFYRCCGYHEVAAWAASHLPEIVLDAIIDSVFRNKYSIRLAKLYTSLFGRNAKQKKTQ